MRIFIKKHQYITHIEMIFPFKKCHCVCFGIKRKQCENHFETETDTVSSNRYKYNMNFEPLLPKFLTQWHCASICVSVFYLNSVFVVAVVIAYTLRSIWRVTEWHSSKVWVCLSLCVSKMKNKIQWKEDEPREHTRARRNMCKNLLFLVWITCLSKLKNAEIIVANIFFVLTKKRIEDFDTHSYTHIET